MKGRSLKGGSPGIRDTQPAILRMWHGFEMKTDIGYAAREIRQTVFVGGPGVDDERIPHTAHFVYFRHEDGIPVYTIRGFEEQVYESSRTRVDVGADVPGGGAA